MGLTEERSNIGWVRQDNGTHICSNCGAKALAEIYFSHKFGREETREVLSDFCPFCGSRMSTLDDGVETIVKDRFV